MEYSSYPHIISDREQREWIEGCPVQVKRVRLTVPAADAATVLSVVLVPTGGSAVLSVEARAEFTDARQKKLPPMAGITLTPGDADASCPDAIPEGAVYAYVIVEKVTLSDGVWINPAGGRGKALPDQRVIWQTDAHYEQIRRETDGVVEAKYYPDAPLPGTWRCACGQINLDSAEECGACGTEKVWLDAHFDEEYLTQQAAEAANRKFAEVPKKKKKKQRGGLSDLAKFVLILSAAALVIAGIALAPVIRKAVLYSKAETMLAEGDYDNAISTFAALGDFTDAPVRLYEANYKKAQQLTGIEEVNLVYTSMYPCFEITPEGVLSFRKDKYTGSFDHFVVPDVVDGVVVRELEKNFFLNCKEMKEVTISDCVEVLGEQTFFNCESLTTVHFGKNVKTVGARCFINCFALTELTIPDTVEKIGLRAFNSCTALEKVTLGSGITVIPSYLFSCCYALTEVTAKAPVTSVDEYAFSECNSFQIFNYGGTAAQWEAVPVAEHNEALLAAEIRFAE